MADVIAHLTIVDRALDARFRSALRTRVAELNGAVDAQRRAGDSIDGASLDTTHPNVPHTMITGRKPRGELSTLRVLVEFCPDP
ncbi:hypothetical protein [Streptomyces buecherae]|uniref:Uncharacterized protein n=1 Tax=Streptomyces buecherae TaxID=2763006 RepID=A0A7H8N344_9ACTN|nr:hypothetical protein [Streptomyces buecherae]QKW48927.1 hypothetical protein HUT08_04520 [Streptomyces buecherae]